MRAIITALLLKTRGESGIIKRQWAPAMVAHLPASDMMVMSEFFCIEPGKGSVQI